MTPFVDRRYEEPMEALLDNKYVFRTTTFFLERYLRYKFKYRCEKVIPESKTFIVVSNHTTNYDAIMLGLSFNKLLYSVASDHIFRWGILSSLIKLLVSPIPRIKGKTEIRTTKEILKRMKRGGSVCIFAEGNRTFSGETVDIPESTGKLVKLSGSGLITYRIDGGYFSNPRWGRNLRRGAMSGRMVAEYSPSQLQKMSPQRINEIIKQDLYVNAYAAQEKKPVRYIGKRLAENLEIALFLCPQCGGMDTLKSRDDHLECSCGLKVKYTPFGRLVDEHGTLPFDTITQWSRWQQSKLPLIAEEYMKSSGDEPLTSDAGQSLFKVERARKSSLIGRGKIALYKDRLVFLDSDGQSFSFPYCDISEMAIYSRMVLIFSTADQISYEIKSEVPRSAVKYLEFFKLLKEKQLVDNK